MKTFLKLAIAAISAASLTQTALADEVWHVEGGEVYYEEDLDNGMAVLRMDDDGGFIRAYIDGLAGVYEGRGSYTGYIFGLSEDTSGDFCKVAMVDPISGRQTYDWGRIEIHFIDEDFPSRWMALTGECDAEPSEAVFARPFTAEDYNKEQ